MHTVTFFPIGNADSCLISLNGGRKLLIDYADRRNPDDPNDRRIDLPAAVRAALNGREYFDVVAFTHSDKDHVQGAADFFYWQHAAKYQTAGRIKVEQLWVPAAFILEANLDGDARVIQAEARHRLRVGAGIRVFSRPEKLAVWLQSQGIEVHDRLHLMSNAGTVVPGFTKGADGIEFFVHSPFAGHIDDTTVIDRNNCSLVLQATMLDGGRETTLLLTADATHELLADIVRVTWYRRNQHRLMWDIVNLPHHCSYLSLNTAEQRGTDVTEPVPEVEWLYGQGRPRGTLVSTSKPIPLNDADGQPPHRQAANYYRRVAGAINGRFIVTMEHPTVGQPQPLTISIDSSGATVRLPSTGGSAAVISRPAPRAG